MRLYKHTDKHEGKTMKDTMKVNQDRRRLAASYIKAVDAIIAGRTGYPDAMTGHELKRLRQCAGRYLRRDGSTAQ